METLRVGILGSAFDPPHFAHAAMVMLAQKHANLAEVWLCPSPNRWDKTPVAPLENRIRWTQILAQSLTKIGFPCKVSTDELELGEFRGTYQFMKHLSNKYPDYSFIPIVGLDAWHSMHTWRDPVANVINGSHLRNDFEFIIIPRGDLNTETPPAPHKLLPPIQTLEKHFSMFEFANVASLSSSFIRTNMANGNLISYAFPELETEILKSEIYARRS